MSAVEAEVQRVMSLICAAPASPGKQAVAQGIADDLLQQIDRLRGQNLSGFASTGAQLQGRFQLSGTGSVYTGLDRSKTRADGPIADFIFGEPGANPGAEERWFEELGITQREAEDASREAEHFNQIDEVGCQIQACCTTIEEVCTTGDIAMQELLSPACRMLEMIVKFGFPQLTDQVIDVAIGALTQASATAKDRNCVIEDCLEAIAKCVEDVAEEQPKPPVEYGGSCECESSDSAVTEPAQTPTPKPEPAPKPTPEPPPKPAAPVVDPPAPPAPDPKPAPEPPQVTECPRLETRCVDTASVGTAAASAVAGLVSQPAPVNVELNFNFDIDGAINAGLETVDCETVDQFQPATPQTETAAWVGTLVQTGAAAVLEGLDCFAASLEAVAECPGAECCTHEVPECPEPEPAPEPEPEPEPECPEPEPVPEDGVIPPPPELSQVEEPAPPPEKLEHIESPATEVAQVPPDPGPADAAEDNEPTENTDNDTPAAADSAEPWAMKKTGEW